MKKEYVVIAWDNENNIIRATYKQRRAAEKFGVKCVEAYGHCKIVTYIGSEKVEEENF